MRNRHFRRVKRASVDLPTAPQNHPPPQRRERQLFELPWPMSEEILQNIVRQQHSSNIYKESSTQETAQTAKSTGSSSTTAVKPRAGALLVEAYGKLVGKQRNTVSPNKVLFEYSKFLVSFPIPKSHFRIQRSVIQPLAAFISIRLTPLSVLRW